MALFALVRAGHVRHEACERLAQSLADKLATCGIPAAAPPAASVEDDGLGKVEDLLETSP